jgi:NAD(P)H-dependent FMN reductase
MEPLNIVAIVGSLRVGSVNRAAARAAIANSPDDVAITLHPIADLPFYNGDVEDNGLPAPVQMLHDVVGAADGVVLFTPEYNSSFPAVMKNAIDWLSRPPRSFEGIPFTVVSATPGGRAGLGVRGHFVDIMTHLPVRLFGETLGIGRYADKLDENGEFTDDETDQEIAEFLGRYAEFIRTGVEAPEA